MYGVFEFETDALGRNVVRGYNTNSYERAQAILQVRQEDNEDTGSIIAELVPDWSYLTDGTRYIVIHVSQVYVQELVLMLGSPVIETTNARIALQNATYWQQFDSAASESAAAVSTLIYRVYIDTRGRT